MLHRQGELQMNLIGIDVSKAKIDVAWLRDAATTKVKTKVFENSLKGFIALQEWLQFQTKESITQCHCVMEATGIYHEPLALWLFEAGAHVSVCNPAHVKNFSKGLAAQHKTDKIDSITLSRYGALAQPPLWQPECKSIRELKALLSRLEALETDLIREKNRLEKAEFSSASSRVVESLMTMIQHLEDEKARLNKEIDDHIDRHPDLKRDQQLLLSIPAIGQVTSRLMLAVIRGKNFKTAAECAAFLGVIPKIQESGIFRGRSAMSKKGNPLIRAKLYMAGVVALKHNPTIRALVQRLMSNGKNKMQALGAAMRKLVHICFGVLKNQQKYISQVA